jgi:hypothetical protein
MADEQQETVLRNSLDAVDRGRRWAMLGVGALFVATVLALGALIGTAAANQGPSRDVGVFKVLFVAAIAQMLLMACCTAILMFHVTRMTKAILRRIELTKRD